MGAERGRNGVMEWWSNGGMGSVFVWILCDSRDPGVVIPLLLELLDQPQQTVFDFVVQEIKLADSVCGKLIGLTQSDRASHRFARGARCDIKELKVFFNRASTVAF